MFAGIGDDLSALIERLDTGEYESKRVLVTGGAGFLGSWLCDALVLSGATVYCVDDLSTGLPENIGHLKDRDGFVFREFDITKPMLEEECDLILHFASHCSPDEYQQHPIQTLEASSHGTQNMLELARRHDCPLLYASSSEVYGSANVLPTPEEYWGIVNPVGPRSCYTEGKRFGEALCFAYRRTHDIDVRVTRLFNTYGPRLRFDGSYARVLSRFIDQALSGSDITVYGDGSQTRSFCYVTDTVAGVLMAAVAQGANGQVLNVGNPEEVSILSLAEKIREATGSNSKITFHPRPTDDPQRRCPDITRVRRILGWSPMIPLEMGLQRTMAWLAHTRLGRR
jgi:nucleoside-diphosphate-sugar epimerase